MQSPACLTFTRSIQRAFLGTRGAQQCEQLFNRSQSVAFPNHEHLVGVTTDLSFLPPPVGQLDSYVCSQNLQHGYGVNKLHSWIVTPLERVATDLEF